jgi:hypothetical protein
MTDEQMDKMIEKESSSEKEDERESVIKDNDSADDR